MFVWKERRDFEHQVEKLVSRDANSNGANRRAISLLPIPPLESEHEITRSEDFKYQQVLLNIEARQTTCCLRIISSSIKSRSAILIFRGRVIGCMYGNKKLKHQLFGEHAHQKAMDDLAQPKNIVDLYELSEEVVLAAASLFHGSVMKVEPDVPVIQLYQQAVEDMIASNSVGCVVLSDSEGLAKCLVYLFAGKIAGVFSFVDGWLEPSFDSGLEILKLTTNGRIMASALNAANETEAIQLCFSLTSLLGDQGQSAKARMDFSEEEARSTKIDPIKNVPQTEALRTTLQLEQIQYHDSGSSGKLFTRKKTLSGDSNKKKK
jgi:hypothetical protein